MNKVILGIWNGCPYLTQHEVETFWKRAKYIAAQKGVKGSQYWIITRKIAQAMATKLDERRSQADESQWLDKQRKRFDGDWDEMI